MQSQDAAASNLSDTSDPLHGYKDARDSDELSFDLEIGDVPLLPQGMEQPEEFARDPSFSCSPSGFINWLRGPTPPHVYHINPWFPRLQAAPGRLIDRKFPHRISKIALLAAGLIFWIIVFFVSLKASVAGQEVTGYGQPVKLSCHHRLWYVDNYIPGLFLWLTLNLGVMPQTVDSMVISVVRLKTSLLLSAVPLVARRLFFLSRMWWAIKSSTIALS